MIGKKKNPKLPQLLERKLFKTGQTRGADDDQIYQNRVSRSSTVLIPYSVWELASKPPQGESHFENGFIVLISPRDYFGIADADATLAKDGIVLGSNALVFYETREQWRSNNPEKLKWNVATSRSAPLGGKFVARISAITSEDGERIIRGFNTTSNKGAGIRSYEYASAAEIRACRLQLEALFWRCCDSERVAAANGMALEEVKLRRDLIMSKCHEDGLLDEARLKDARILGAGGKTVCPLCLEEISSQGFFNRLKQAEGREVLDLTVTQLNLFHIQELRYGAFNHRAYNLGWGHHHCNVVVKDVGITETLEWMDHVLSQNVSLGHFASSKKGS